MAASDFSRNRFHSLTSGLELCEFESTQSVIHVSEYLVRNGEGVHERCFRQLVNQEDPVGEPSHEDASARVVVGRRQLRWSVEKDWFYLLQFAV